MTRDERSAGPVMRPLLLAVASGWLVFAAMNAAAGSRWRTVSFEISAAALTLIIREIVRVRPSAWRAAVHGAAALNTLVLVVLAWLGGGGVQGLACWYLPAIPLFVTHLDGRRAGWLWCGIAAAASLAATTIDPGIPAEFIAGDGQRIVAGVWLVVICTSFAALSRREVDTRMDELERVARARSELTAAISHDIRTPLHGILGVTTVLSETELGAEQRQLVATLASSGRTLQRIVDDVLDAAQLESGRFRIVTAPIDLRETLEDTVDLHGPDAAAKALSLTLHTRGGEAFRVIGDDVRLRQVVSNLVGNAVKFTREGSVTVRASARREGTRSVVELRVEDTGPGIPGDQAGRLFERFERLDTDSSRREGGTGLGLAISRDLVRLMGGSIELEQGRASGAAFVVRLAFEAQEPRQEPARDEETVRSAGAPARGLGGPPTTGRQEPGTATRPALGAGARGRALLIDDDPTNRRILEQIVAHRGFTAVAEPSGLAALERLRQERFDLIVCDLHMPGMDGLEFVAQARAAGHPGRYVAATASVRDDDPARCRAAGFDAFLRKPFHVAELDAILASVDAPPITGPVLDETAWAAARALMGQEHASLVREHLVAAGAHVRTICERTGDAADVERAAHTLCAGSLMLGLVALGTAARALEAEARTMTPEARQQAGARLVTILRATVEATERLGTDGPLGADRPARRTDRPGLRTDRPGLRTDREA